MIPAEPRPASLSEKPSHPTHTPTAPRGPAGDASAPPALAQPLSLNTLIQGLKRCWPLAVGVGLVAGLVGAAVAYVVVPGKYVAQAQLHVNTVPTGPGVVHESAIAFDNYVKTQSATITGDGVIRKALRRPEVAGTAEIQAQGDPEAWMQKNLSTDTLLGPELLRVNLSGDRPDDLVVIIGGVVETYLDAFKAEEDKRAEERIEQLRETRKKYSQQLNVLRGKFADELRAAGLEEPQTLQSRFNAALQAFTTAEAQRRQLIIDVTGAKAELKQEESKLEKPDAIEVPSLAIDDELRNDPAYRVQQDAVARAQLDYDDVSHAARDSNLIKSYKDRLDKAQLALDRMREQSRPRVVEKLRAKVITDARANIAKLESKIQAISKQQEALDQEIEGTPERRGLKGEYQAVQKQMQEANKLPPHLEAKRDEISGLEQVLTRTNLELSSLEVERPRPRVTLKQEASRPTAPKLDKFIKYGSVAFMGLFIFGAMGVAVVECLRRRVYGSTDVSQGLGINLLGTVPKLSDTARKPLPASTPEEYALTAPMTESVDTIRTVLLRSPGNAGVKVVMVTSATGGEGKTSLACHLAASLARSGKRTVLLDGDLRKPAVHRQFELPLEPGFSEYLRAEMDFEDVVLPTPVGGLAVIPAGRWDPAASQALSHETVASCFDRLRQEYDYVIVDVPPVLPLADAMLVGQHADAVVFAVLRDVSRIPAVWQAYQRLAALGIRMLGAVVIGEDVSAYGTYSATVTKAPAQPTA